MPKRDRFADLAPWIVLAFCLCIAAGIAYWHAYSKGYQTANEDIQANRKAYDIGQEAYEECSRKTAVEEALECYRKAEKATREDHRAEQDLNAQREMANWAEAMLVATVVIGALSIAVTGAGIFYVRKTLMANSAAVDEAREANRISKENFVRDSRPWLDFEITLDESPSITPTHGVVFWATVSIKNHGRTPASRVHFKIHAWPLNAHILLFEADRGSRWFDVHYNLIAAGGGKVVFPGQTIEYRTIFTMDPREWDQAASLTAAAGIQKIVVHGTARAYYSYGGSAAFTEKNLTIRCRDDNGTLVDFNWPLEVVQPDRLALSAGAWGDVT